MAVDQILKGQQYISLETYRKSGQAMRTPVWFAQENNTLYVWTIGTSGKAKRIRNNGAVKVAPSDRSGNPLGEYIAGSATVNPISTPAYQHGNHLLDKKYGLIKKIFGFMGRKYDSQRVIIEIKLS